jgi:hypothetical protein
MPGCCRCNTLGCIVFLLLLLCSGVKCIKVRVWTNVTDPSFIYPELDPHSDFGIQAIQEKPSLGIAMSGGGLRAAPLAFGWLRAMHLVCNSNHNSQ